MLKNNVKVAYRSLLKNSVFSLINIVGLAVGISAFVLILKFVSYELSYDKWHQHSDRIYRVALNKYQGNQEVVPFATNFNALPKAIREYIPTVEKVTMPFRPASGIFIFTYRQGDRIRQFQEDHFLYADEYFTTIFSYNFIAGNPALALEASFSIVLTESAARKYFGSDTKVEDIIGQRMEVSSFSQDIQHTVTGIVADVPANTHLSFDLLLSASSFEALYPEENFADSWEWYDTYVYLLAQTGTEATQLTTQLQSLLQTNSEAMGEGKSVKSKVVLQPLTNIHLHSHRQLEAEANGSYQHIAFLLIIASALLIVAGLNYANMSTALSLKRIREVGIRKYLGATKRQLRRQTLTETGLILLLALAITLVCISLVLPQLPTSPVFSANWFDPYFVASVVLGLTVLLVLIGYYPARFAARFEPINAIKGRYKGHAKLQYLQNSLIGFQLFIGLLTLTFTFMLYQQYQFMHQQNLGFEEQLLVFSAPTVQTVRGTEAYATQVQTFKERLIASGAIGSVSASTHVPGRLLEYSTSKIYAEGQDAGQGIDMNFIGIDADYVKTLGLKIVAGENFAEKSKSDEVPYILNEKAARALGFTDPVTAVGQYVTHHGSQHRVQAVVNDYHQKSLQEPIIPLAFVYLPTHHEYFMVKLASSDVASTIERVSALFAEHFPDNPFSYYFLDDAFQQLYQAEQQYSRFFNALSVLMILISSLGLFSMATFSAQQRTQEIGIRKTLGASTQGIIALLAKDYIKLLVLASIVAMPIAYVSMQLWLENYAFRIDVSWQLIVFPLVIILLVTLFTISFKTVQAALANPVDSLKQE
ncbi:ABC transporter permease [Tunicatimonas pelagia]|uniref:ABC transporter permease n=1 Tax=Tunicatimonas pelagia TaxID=931531 RepID=UPI002666A277|nr:FtsX-like permease family protein [Tunicatimonas pelagia]WKN43656.1 ABC transporter permease [Tunicatimonas pelagia]